MIPNDQPLRRQTIERMILRLADDICNLTRWEYNFITSLSEQFDSKGDISQKQAEILEQLYDKVG